jgi:hypothetical protein
MQVGCSLRVSLYAAATVLLLLLPHASAQAQVRLNDKDLEHIMKNLHEDAKDFREAFDASIHKSAIRNTSQDKNARGLAEQFERQADDMYKHFKGSKKAEGYVWPIVRTAGDLDGLVYSLSLDSKTTLSWEKVRSELRQISNSFGVAEPSSQTATPIPSGE